MKLKNKSGFTLTELIVVMVVSSIFMGMVMAILANSFNIFNRNEKQANMFSDSVIVDNMFSVFMEEVNKKDGKSLLIKKDEEKIFLDEYNYIDINDSEKTIYLVLNGEEIKRDENKEYKNFDINIDLIDNNSFMVTYYSDDEVIKNNVINVIGGISYE